MWTSLSGCESMCRTYSFEGGEGSNPCFFLVVFGCVRVCLCVFVCVCVHSFVFACVFECVRACVPCQCGRPCRVARACAAPQPVNQNYSIKLRLNPLTPIIRSKTGFNLRFFWALPRRCGRPCRVARACAARTAPESAPCRTPLHPIWM